MYLHFATSNPNKIALLQQCLPAKIQVQAVDLVLMEPQTDSVEEVSKSKALQAYACLKQPAVVEDGGLYIPALHNFPGVYVKYIMQTIGAVGILQLMQGQTNREATFHGCTTYVDAQGNLQQFSTDTVGSITTTEAKVTAVNQTWSPLWYIFYLPEYRKTLAELSTTEYQQFLQQHPLSISVFADWYVQQQSLES